MSQESRSSGKYIGEYVADIYIKRGDIWEQGGVKHEVTSKIYIITSEDYDYDIEVGTALPTKRPAGRKNNLALPIPPELATDTHEYLLTIAPGDDYVDRRGKAWKVTGKYYRPMSGGRLTIGIFIQ